MMILEVMENYSFLMDAVFCLESRILGFIYRLIKLNRQWKQDVRKEGKKEVVVVCNKDVGQVHGGRWWLASQFQFVFVVFNENRVVLCSVLKGGNTSAAAAAHVMSEGTVSGLSVVFNTIAASVCWELMDGVFVALQGTETVFLSWRIKMTHSGAL